MRKKKDNQFNLLLIFAVLNLVLLVGLIAYIFYPSDIPKLDSVKYIMYIGTNCKDTYSQLIPTEEAINIVNEICARHIGGYTVHQASGGWIDEQGILTQENTLVYTLMGIDEKKVMAIMDEVLVALNQNSILLERQAVSSTYYVWNVEPKSSRRINKRQ